MKKGFTLIELLVVIAILAVLMSVVVVTINPAEMLKKTRDTKRISDLDALRTAINLYVTDGLSFATTGCATCVPGVPLISGCTSYNATTSQSISNGWIGFNLGNISSGSPLSALPIDPKPSTNTGNTPNGWHAYILKTNITSSTFKLMANMESTYYSNTTPASAGDVESTDGGTLPDVYEVGSDVNL
ncbi:MAG TPA: type II secretion system protein [Candidatus Paceibacterota bacterium]|nr:type II secretion system protein [Candidatus Paceibacterota bacterium]